MVVRLIQQQQIGLPDQQPRQTDQFGLPAAEGVNRPIKGLIAQPQVAQGRADAILVGQPAGGLIVVQQPGMVVHHPRQPGRFAVDRRIAHACFGRGQRLAQAGDLG